MSKRLFSFEFFSVSQALLKMLWGCLLVSGILLNPMYSYPGRDAGIFMYIGSLILKGRLPYLDVWENKGPLVFYINAIGLWMGDGSRWGIWLMEFLFLVGAAWLCYFLIHSVMDGFSALVGVFVMITAAGALLQGGNYSEEYSVLFSCLALWAFVRGMADPKKKIFDMLIGLSLGLNILLRPNNISMQVAVAGGFFVLTFFSKDWKLLVRRAVFIVAGAAVAVVPMLLYLVSQGAFTEMINVVLKFNYQYSSDTGFTEVYQGIRVGVIALGFIIPIIALLGYILSMFVMGRGLVRKTEFPPLLVVLLIGAPIELLLSTLSGRSYLHYFIGWAPYLGVLCAYAVFWSLGGFMLRLEKNVSMLLFVLILVTIIVKLETWRGYGTVLQNIKMGQVEYVDPIAMYIRENTTEQDKVLIWGFRPVINFVSDREAPVSFLPYPLVHVNTPLTNAWAEEFYFQLTSDPPKLIVNYIEPADRERIPDLDQNVRKEQKIKWKEVVLASNLNETMNFIEENYIKVENVNGADIYQLKTSLP